MDRRIAAIAELLAVVIVVTGCAPAGERSGTAIPGGGERATTTRPPVVAALGDSITAGSPYWDPDPKVRRALATDERSQYEYWAQLSHPGTRWRNCGQRGKRTDQIARHLKRCARGADVLIVQGGINDLVQDVPPDVIVANLDRMITRGLDLGLRVAVAELVPWNNGPPEAGPVIRQINQRIADAARVHEVPVLGWHDLLADPADRDRMAAEFTDDGDHPSVRGYRVLGESLRLP